MLTGDPGDNLGVPLTGEIQPDNLVGWTAVASQRANRHVAEAWPRVSQWIRQ